MRRVIFLFLDGVGLGDDDATRNPLAAGTYPTLAGLLDGHKAVAAAGHYDSGRARLLPVDAHMGVEGRPQSATGQAAILTGINAPARLGEHYGPRPDARVRAVLDEGSLFRRLRDVGLTGYFVNAYPERFFQGIRRGKRLLSAVPYAATVGGQALLTHADLLAGRALAADFTNQAWRDQLGYVDAPVFTPGEGGRELWRIAQAYDFVFFEHWMTDLLGHRRDLSGAVEVLTTFDGFLAGLLDAADLQETLIIVGSDHGNVEDCSHSKHTQNPALALLTGADYATVAAQINALDDMLPAVLRFLGVEMEAPSAPR